MFFKTQESPGHCLQNREIKVGKVFLIQRKIMKKKKKNPQQAKKIL